MDREHIKGAADKAKGAIKDTAGKIPATRNCNQKASSTRPKARHTTRWAMSKTQPAI